ncbi:hypothetical protein PMIN06_008223 [Paraphaeosphaeria minitans]
MDISATKQHRVLLGIYRILCHAAPARRPQCFHWNPQDGTAHPTSKCRLCNQLTCSPNDTAPSGNIQGTPPTSALFESFEIRIARISLALSPTYLPAYMHPTSLDTHVDMLDT